MFDIQLADELDALRPRTDRTHLVLLAGERGAEVARLDGIMGDAEWIAVVVPQLIRGHELLADAAALISFDPARSFLTRLDMRDDAAAIAARLHPCGHSRSLLLFCDGLSAHVEGFVRNLEVVIGGIDLMGAGLGCADLVRRPVVFDRDGAHIDHAVLLGSGIDFHVGVRHGWDSVHGPLVVTRADRNIIHELNHEPALAVYRRALADAEGLELTADGFATIAAGHPLGIASFQGGEPIVRDPVAAGEDGSVTVISGVREMDALFVMKGDAEKLVAAVAGMAGDVLARVRARRVLVFDCISRVNFLGERFAEEMRAVEAAAGGAEVIGLTSVGEITNVGFEGVRILNKTCLVGAVADE
ncbi:FIST C-terminal domain-containing protein [bacterium]|nr:FIST C-terminal domain-containing protein [bacterium]